MVKLLKGKKVLDQHSKLQIKRKFKNKSVKVKKTNSMDKRKFNKGTKGNKGGRPPKDSSSELHDRLNPMSEMGIQRLKEGIERGDFNYLKLYFQYRYGKPKQISQVTVHAEQPLFDLNSI